MKILSSADYERLKAESEAWRRHVQLRLTDGQAPGTIVIECLEGAATLRAHIGNISTVNGRGPLQESDASSVRMSKGDTITIDATVRLRT